VADNIIEFGTDDPLGRPSLTAGSRETPRIEFGGPGGGFGARAGASIPVETEGKVKFLERVFGEGNVVTTRQGEILIRDPKTGVMGPFDERNISVKDVTADIVGPAMQVAPMVAGATASPLGAAAGAAAGTIARQAATDVLTGGESGETAGGRLFDIALGASLAAGSQALVNAGARVFDAMRPRNFVVRQVRKGEATPFARKGRRLSEQTGVKLTLGEETGLRSQMMVEAIGRRTPGGADLFYTFHQTQLRSSLSFLKTALDKFSPQKGSFAVGDDVTKAFDSALDSATTIRRAQAAEDFGELHRVSNGQPLIPTNTLVKEIQQMVDELDVPGAGDATQKVVGQARQLLTSLIKDDAPTRLTGEQANRLLQIYTNAQRGTGVLLRDMDKAQSRFLSGRLKDALLKDVDTAVGEAGDAGTVAQALRAARDHYRINSAAVNEIADSTLSRLIGNGTRSPEAIAEKLIGMQPSEVRSIMGLIDRGAPDTGNAVRRFFVESAVDAARHVAPSRQTASGVKFSSATFLKNLPDLETMKAAGFTRPQIVEVAKVAKVLERVSDKAFEGSPTAFAGITWDAIRGVFTLNPVAVARSAGAIIAPRVIAKAVLTAEGRQALRTLATTSPGTKKGLAAVTTLQAIIATEPGGEDVRPLSPLDDDNTFTMENVFVQ
jgi:hypothetical protein